MTERDRIGDMATGAVSGSKLVYTAGETEDADPIQTSSTETPLKGPTLANW